MTRKHIPMKPEDEMQAVSFLACLGGLLGCGIAMSNPSTYSLPMFGFPVIIGSGMVGLVLAFVAGLMLAATRDGEGE